MQKFADARFPAEKDEIFEKITNYGSVFKGKDTLRTALDQLFDKQQEMAVNKVTTAVREQTEINPNNHLEAAKSIVAEYSLFFEPTKSLRQKSRRIIYNILSR